MRMNLSWYILDLFLPEISCQAPTFPADSPLLLFHTCNRTATPPPISIQRSSSRRGRSFVSRGDTASWKLAERSAAPWIDRALINGAPVAAPVTMQFALHRDSVSRSGVQLCVCILGRGEGARRGAAGNGTGARRLRAGRGSARGRRRGHRRSSGICSEVTKP